MPDGVWRESIAESGERLCTALIDDDVAVLDLGNSKGQSSWQVRADLRRENVGGGPLGRHDEMNARRLGHSGGAGGAHLVPDRWSGRGPRPTFMRAGFRQTPVAVRVCGARVTLARQRACLARLSSTSRSCWHGHPGLLARGTTARRRRRDGLGCCRTPDTYVWPKPRGDETARSATLRGRGATSRSQRRSRSDPLPEVVGSHVPLRCGRQQLGQHCHHVRSLTESARASTAVASSTGNGSSLNGCPLDACHVRRFRTANIRPPRGTRPGEPVAPMVPLRPAERIRR